MNFTLILTGRVKPYVRMTRKGKFVRPEAIEYLASQSALKWQIKQQMTEDGWGMLPGQTPLCVRVELQVDGGQHRGDIDNLTKAVLDAGNGILYPDDRWIDRLEVKRSKGPANITILTVGTI